ncbi:hypothetical protein Sjap_002510 [Stephania japonica]|uniref:RING-type domain-containing protein n=1 Tax=Stephania japonica TaxID=461633 RepID=A0AAP0KMX8_9MAGN
MSSLSNYFVSYRGCLRQQPSESVKFSLKLRLSFMFNWVIFSDYEDESPMVLQEVPGPVIIKTSYANPSFLTSEFVSQLIVQDLLFGINIPYSVFNLLKIEISSLACSLARLDERMGRLVWPITFDVRITLSIPYEDFDFDNYEIEEPFEDTEDGTILRITPAERSTFEALKKIQYLGLNVDTGKDFVICLGEFEVGSELTCMPCAHAFHAFHGEIEHESIPTGAVEFPVFVSESCCGRLLDYEDESPMVLQEVPGPVIIKTSYANPSFLTSEFISQLIVQDLLFGINIPYSVFNLLKTDISSLACSLARLDVRMGRLVWPITFDVRITLSIPYEDFDFDNYEIEEPFEDPEDETILRITPAERSSFEALKKIQYLGLNVDTGNDCAICLGEFEVGSELTCMPCAHAFHGECIVEWLERSNQCPLCRFELPT